MYTAEGANGDDPKDDCISSGTDVLNVESCSSDDQRKDKTERSRSSEWDFLRHVPSQRLNTSTELVLRIECMPAWEFRVRKIASYLKPG